MKPREWCYHVVIAFLAFAAGSCGSSDVAQNLTAEDRFEAGKKKFDDEDYLEAIQDFQAVTTQYPGSAVADDAQYYLGEARFRRGEYLLAAHEYEMLKKTMQASPFLAISSYKIGLCYYHLSPKSPLDQEHTKRAIEEFQSFIEYFPTHELVQDAEAKIRELNNKLAKKDYDTAILYMKMESYKSATFYFDSVLEKFHDSEYAEAAHLGKIQALVARKRFDEAKVEVEKFLSKYPDSKQKNEIQRLENLINNQLKEHSAMNGEIVPRAHARGSVQ